VAWAPSCSYSLCGTLARMAQVMAANELRFTEAVKLLQSYSMIERLEDLKSYETHPVVHRWASYIQDGVQKKSSCN